MQKTLTRAAASLSALFLAGTLAGCGGSSNNNSINNDDTVIAPQASLLGLRAGGTSLRAFSSQSANIGTSTVNISGLQNGEQLVGIDYRSNPLNGGTAGLYGLSNQKRLYVISSGGAATQVGSTAFSFDNANPTLNDPGFDFNPTADRIRLVQGTFNARLNETVTTGNPAVDGDPNTAGTQTDTALAYAEGDTNFGKTPNVVGAAYTNSFAGASSTVNYAIDATQGVLVTQGRPDPDGEGPLAAVSPNSGQLFTVGSLGVSLGNSRVSFEISGTSNNAFMVLSNGGTSRLYVINLATGRARRARSGTTSGIIGLTTAPETTNF